MLLVALGAMAFAILQPIQVLPRIRLAPGYALLDQSGEVVTSEDGRGVISLYTFVPADCGDRCDAVHATMAEVQDRVGREVDLGGAPFRLVTIVLDPGVDTDVIASAREQAGADWTWLAGSERQVENVVGLGFRRSTSIDDFTPSYAIVDGWGMIRGEYRYQTLADDPDKLTRHIGVLGSELRNKRGLVSFVYEAAHAFQCYP